MSEAGRANNAAARAAAPPTAADLGVVAPPIVATAPTRQMGRKTAARSESRKKQTKQKAKKTRTNEKAKKPEQKNKRGRTDDLTSGGKKSAKPRLSGASPPLGRGQKLKDMALTSEVRFGKRQHDAAEALGGFLVSTTRRTCACCGGRAAHECAVCGVALHKPNEQCAWPCSDIFHNKTREGDCWIDYLKVKRSAKRGDFVCDFV